MSTSTTSTALDAQAAAQLARFDGFEVGGTATQVGAQRAHYKSLLLSGYNVPLRPFEGTVVNRFVRTGDRYIPVRQYTPTDTRAGAAVVYMHGGGWVLGDLDTGDRLARELANKLRLTVVSVDYRRAPESAFPAAFEDCLAVASDVRDNFGTWCGLVGDSAGGNLAAAVALASRGTASRQFDAQLLLYPCLDAAMSGASYATYASGAGLTREAMTYYWSAYGDAANRDDPLFSIASAPSLVGLPATVLAAAGVDVLVDEGKEFAKRLLDDGVCVTYLPSPELPHGFAELVDRVDLARASLDRAVHALRAHLVSGLKEDTA